MTWISPLVRDGRLLSRLGRQSGKTVCKGVEISQSPFHSSVRKVCSAYKLFLVKVRGGSSEPKGPGLEFLSVILWRASEKIFARLGIGLPRDSRMHGKFCSRRIEVETQCPPDPSYQLHEHLHATEVWLFSSSHILNVLCPPVQLPSPP